MSKVKFSLQYSIYFECLDIFGKQVVLQISCEIESERAFFLDMGMVLLPGLKAAEKHIHGINHNLLAYMPYSLRPHPSRSRL